LVELNRAVPGVGVLFNPALSNFVCTDSESLDYIEVIPDRSWVDRGPGFGKRFEELPAVYKILTEVAQAKPVVMHCIGLSICSAGLFDEEYLSYLARWREKYDCAWVSEHLSYSRNGTERESNAAVALSIPYDTEMLDMVSERVNVVQARLGCPFLLENNVDYLRIPNQEMTEAEFLNRLTHRTGCYLLLDLHNVYTNAVNHKVDAFDFLTALDLTRVLEIHVAGGISMMGFHVDSHTGPVLEEVWELLRFVAPRAPALRGVTFEFHESSWRSLRDEGVKSQLSGARNVLAAL